jgi:hypothetical protein
MVGRGGDRNHEWHEGHEWERWEDVGWEAQRGMDGGMEIDGD